MITIVELEEAIISFLNIYDFKNLALVSKNWNKQEFFRLLNISRVENLISSETMNVLLTSIPSSLAPNTLYIDIKTQYQEPIEVHFAFLNIFNVPKKASFPTETLQGLKPNDYNNPDNLSKYEDFSKRIVDFVLSHLLLNSNSKTLFLNSIPLMQRYSFTFAHVLQTLPYQPIKNLPCTSILGYFMCLLQEPERLAQACYKNPDLAYAIVSNSFLKKKLPMVEQYSSQNNIYLLNHIPYENLKLLFRFSMYLALIGPWQFYFYGYGAIVQVLLTLFVCGEDFSRHYKHYPRSISVKQIADEFTKGIASEDKSILLIQEKAAFQLLLEKEKATLSQSKSNWFKVFSCKNASLTRMQLEYINQALLKLATINSHEEFIVYKADLLKNKELRGGRMCGLMNDAFYNKMLQF